jgi:glycosyltransferase involved in cell wall biosynthesis
MAATPGLNPKISLLVTAYNFEKYIGAAVESLLNQSGGYDYEVIVVDDCSTDGTEAVMSRFSDPRLRYIRSEKNRGAVWSANHAFSLARGEYIARFDGDDVWYPWFLEETVPVLDSHPELALVYGDIHMVDGSGKVTEEGIYRPDLPVQGNEFLPLLRRHYTCAPAMLGRRSAWENALPYPEALKSGLADWFLTLKMALDQQFRFVPKALAQYRVHGGGMHHAFILNKKGERNMRYILDYFGQLEGHSDWKQEMRKIYALHYRQYGSSYFGADMESDARRCFLEALRCDWSLSLDVRFLLLLMGSLMGKHNYNKLKYYFSLRRDPNLLQGGKSSMGS